MTDRSPVKTLEELDQLDHDDVLEGYKSGHDGDPEPGDNRSKSFWHGWRNGRADRYGDVDDAQHALAREYLKAKR